MSWFRAVSDLPGNSSSTGGSDLHIEERRRSIRSSVLGSGTLACRRCDAPVALASGSALLGDVLTCPYCDVSGPVRDFLSLAAPTRPARVVVRVAVRPRAARR